MEHVQGVVHDASVREVRQVRRGGGSGCVGAACSCGVCVCGCNLFMWSECVGAAC